MNRTVQLELLDELPANDPEAIRSRRDLQRVNQWMGNAQLLASLLQQLPLPSAPKVIVELGAGDGTLLLRVLQQMQPQWPRGKVLLVDRQPVVKEETLAQFKALGWRVEVITADVFDWLNDGDNGPVDLIVTNLFLHHFPQNKLRTLLQLVAQMTDWFAACEPRRSAFALNAARLLWVIACNAVTQHDAVISVQAGFTDGELSALWPADKEWRLEERPAGFFGHIFAAGKYIPEDE